MWIHLESEELEHILSALKRYNNAESRRLIGLIEQKAQDQEGLQDWIDKARTLYQKDGKVEVDDGAIVSLSEDGGAYVMAWVWVSNADMGIKDEDEDEESIKD